MEEIKKKYLLLKIPFTIAKKDFLIGQLKELIVQNSPPKQIITINLDNLRISTEDKLFHKTIKESDYILPDGFGIAFLLKKKFNINIERITGNDLLEELINIASANNIKTAFIGASPKTLNFFNRRLKKLFPEWNDYLFHPPSQNFLIGSEEDLILREKLLSFKPDIVFAALGCPKQEIWLNEIKNEVGAKINIGIGAAFDFYSGTKKRAPKIFQKLGFEWLWRLSTEPNRLFRRYILQDFPFLFNTLKQEKRLKVE